MRNYLSKKQLSLKAWIKQKWRTKSGKNSSLTGERYLPQKAIKVLTSNEYALTTKLKRKSKKKGKQFSLQPLHLVEKVRNYRNEWKKFKGKSKNENYTKPKLRQKLFKEIKALYTHGTLSGQWSARKAQFLAKKYKAMGGGYK